MILNSLQEPSAESKHITGIVPPGLRLDGLCQQSRQRHRDRFSVFKRDQQGYGIAALVDKFELYRLAVVESFARRELAAADDHGFGSVCRGRLCCHMESASRLRVEQVPSGNDRGETRLQADPGPEHETSAVGQRYICMDITYPCGAMQSLARLRYTQARQYRRIVCSIAREP